MISNCCRVWRLSQSSLSVSVASSFAKKKLVVVGQGQSSWNINFTFSAFCSKSLPFSLFQSPSFPFSLPHSLISIPLLHLPPFKLSPNPCIPSTFSLFSIHPNPFFILPPPLMHSLPSMFSPSHFPPYVLTLFYIFVPSPFSFSCIYQQDLVKCESEMQAWEQAFQNSKAWFEEYVSETNFVCSLHIIMGWHKTLCQAKQRRIISHHFQYHYTWIRWSTKVRNPWHICNYNIIELYVLVNIAWARVAHIGYCGEFMVILFKAEVLNWANHYISLIPRPSHVFQRCTWKIGKAWSIMWCNDDMWTLFGMRFT